MNQKIVIEAQGLRKSYGSFEALKGVDLEVYEGEIFGFLGPNGAGKTTTIRCFLDLIRPQAGSLRILGLDPQSEPAQVRALIGYLPGELHLHENLTGRETLEYFSSLRNGEVDWQYTAELVDRLALELDRPIRNLSLGNKQKIGVIQALMHKPRLVLMDEPTTGLDPLMQQEVMGMLREATSLGCTVFFSSHIISEVEALAERVAIIRKGVVAELLEVKELRERALRRVHVRFSESIDPSAFNQLEGVESISQDDSHRILFQVEGALDPFIKQLAQYEVADLETLRPTLEEIFMNYYANGPEGEI
jgi:ABC-2 type transport system ATP-binding protein